MHASRVRKKTAGRSPPLLKMSGRIL